MNKPTWLTINPTSKDSGGTYNVVHSASVNTGRDQRECYLAVQGKNGSTAKKNYHIIQAGAEGFIDGEDVTVTADATTAILSGTSNCDNFSILAPSVTGQISPNFATFNGEGITTEEFSNFLVTGRPGKQGLFNWSINFELTENYSASSREWPVTLDSPQFAHSAVFVIKQLGGDPQIDITPREITIPANGSAVNVIVTSNVGWEVTDAADPITMYEWESTASSAYNVYVDKNNSQLSIGTVVYTKEGNIFTSIGEVTACSTTSMTVNGSATYRPTGQTVLRYIF